PRISDVEKGRQRDRTDESNAVFKVGYGLSVSSDIRDVVKRPFRRPGGFRISSIQELGHERNRTQRTILEASDVILSTRHEPLIKRDGQIAEAAQVRCRQ